MYSGSNRNYIDHNDSDYDSDNEDNIIPCIQPRIKPPIADGTTTATIKPNDELDEYIDGPLPALFSGLLINSNYRIPNATSVADNIMPNNNHIPLNSSDLNNYYIAAEELAIAATEMANKQMYDNRRKTHRPHIHQLVLRILYPEDYSSLENTYDDDRPNSKNALTCGSSWNCSIPSQVQMAFDQFIETAVDHMAPM
jgi:hypothetical protein